MARPRNAVVDPVEARLVQVEARLDEVARLLTILIARDRSLQDTIADLSAVKFGPTRIAELTGTSHGYAKVAVDRARKRKKTTARGAEE